MRNLNQGKIGNSKTACAVSLLLCLLVFTGCNTPKAAETKAPPPATVENAKKETDLATVKLTPEAEKRLGIVTAPIEMRDVARTLELSGEVVMPPGQTYTVAAPLAGTLHSPETNLAAADASTTKNVEAVATPVVGAFVRRGQALFRLTPFLSPERDLRVQLEREVATLQERVAGIRQRKERAEMLASEKAGSQRAVEEAQADLAVAEADLKGARERLLRNGNGSLASDFEVPVVAPSSGVIQKVNASVGQTTAGGAVLLELANYSTLWLRVPVYVGDLPKVARSQPARIHGLNDAPGTSAFLAKPIVAPPTADAAASTADLYYALSNTGGMWRPGQRVGVTLSARAQEQSLAVPWSAVLHDIQGGTWVYENTAAHTFIRRSVEVRYVIGEWAVLGRAPNVGAKIVTVAAAELFSTEFGGGK
jgi:membrane fusion protein, heavy metal efflux system